MSAYTVILLLIIGLAAGFLSGLVGVGGGIIIVPALMYFLKFDQHQAQGSSLGLLMLPVGIFAVINYYKKGYLDVNVVAIMSISFVAGAFLGSNISLAISQEKLKKVFAILLLFVAFKMLFLDKKA